MNHTTTAAIAEQRRNEMMQAAAQRSLARTARAARRTERPTGRLRTLLAVFFTGASTSPAPAPASTAVEPATAEPPGSASADWRTAA
jgi:hypothetical protein